MLTPRRGWLSPLIESIIDSLERQERGIMDSPKTPELDTPTRILLGPGPGMPHPRVVRALTTPVLGHLDPELLQVYRQEQDLLRYVFQTGNEWTFALSGTGTAGMEAALVNLIEAGDRVL